MKTIRYILFLIIGQMSLFSCSVSKFMPANESLYKGANVNIIPAVALNIKNIKQLKAVKEELTSIVRPLPNSRLLGFPYKVWFYYVIGQPKKDGDLRSWFRKRLAEDPIFAHKNIIKNNAELLSNFLENEGYFGSSVTGSFEEKNGEKKATYITHLKPRYYINEVSFMNTDKSAFGESLKSTENETILKNKSNYSLQDIKTERERIANALQNKGFYLFYPDYIIILADTTVGDHKVNLTISVKPNTAQIAKKQYFIKDIFVNFNDTHLDSTNKNTEQKIATNFHLNNSSNYKNRIFKDAIGFRSGSVYSNDLQNISLSRLVNLGNFKFVKNRFDLLPRSDSALLSLNYYLTSIKKRSLSAEVGGVSKSNNLVGTNLSLVFHNRNTFRGGEQLSLSANILYEWQLGGTAAINYNDNYRWFLESTLSVPRFLVPFVKINPETNQALPKTNFTLRYEKVIKKHLYDQNSFSAAMGYAWRKGQAEHSYIPFSVNLVRTKATTEFVTQIFLSNNPAELIKILEERLVLGATYNFNIASKKQSNHTIVFNGGIDLAGNLAGLIAPKAAGSEARQIFNIVYEQYARFDADIRYYKQLSPNVRWANRLMVGVGLPHGNSKNLPYFKQFFSGGTNSIRAFRARTLGPGSFSSADNYVNSTIGGDMKLEINTELRAKFTNYIHGALFVDAGNVWLYKNFSFYDDKALFSKNFLSELAVGTGVGLRLDFTYVLFRFDVAFPIRKPWLDPDKRWVLNQINFSNHTWRDENILFNIAVGYPF